MRGRLSALKYAAEESRHCIGRRHNLVLARDCPD
jgi:hypothetical protein